MFIASEQMELLCNDQHNGDANDSFIIELTLETLILNVSILPF